MNETNPGHEQTQGRSRRIRREERTSEHHHNSDCSEAARSERRSVGCKSQRTNRTIRTGISQCKSRGDNVGGILRQLIGKADNQLARISSRINQLETERQNLEREWEEARLEKEQLQALLENLQQSMQENP